MATFDLSSKSVLLASGNSQIRRQESVKKSTTMWRKGHNLQNYTNDFTFSYYFLLKVIP